MLCIALSSLAGYLERRNRRHWRNGQPQVPDRRGVTAGLNA
jgi:hypothetical protein